MNVEIRKCTLDDLEKLQKISVETYTDTFEQYNTEKNMQIYLEEAYNPEKLKGELLKTGSDFFFLFFDGKLAGYLKINEGEAQTEQVAKQALEVERIYIRSGYKRKGLGKQLIMHALTIAEKRKMQHIWLGVWEHNFPALEFYRKMGFFRQGAHDFYMGSDKQTDYIMLKKLVV